MGVHIRFAWRPPLAELTPEGWNLLSGPLNKSGGPSKSLHYHLLLESPASVGWHSSLALREPLWVGTAEVEMEAPRMGLGISGKGAPGEAPYISCFLGMSGLTCSTLGPHPSSAFFTSQIINWGTQYRAIRVLEALIYCDFDVWFLMKPKDWV